MRILVTWGSKQGGTEGIARIVGEELQRQGIEVALKPASEVRDVAGYDAAIIGGSLYANRWHRDSHRLLTRNIAALRKMPVWLFSSGPLDDSADRGELSTPREVQVLRDRIGALGHTEFGGRLAADAKGFPASAMAKNRAGDWRNPDRIRAWAAEIARQLPTARPGTPIDPPGDAPWRVVAYGVVGWAISEALIPGLLYLASAPAWLAITLHVIATLVVFTALSSRYFAAPGARDPILTATSFVVVAAILDLAVTAGLVLHNFDMFRSLAGTWLPFVLIFLATWITGWIRSMMPARPRVA